MPELASHLKCTGCAACLLSCPRGAIRMSPDKEGFVFPVVEVSLCVECGLCEQRCPVRMVRKRDATPMCYAAKSNDDRLVMESSSGGLFSEFALSVLGRGGAVFGAAHVGENLDVKHIAVESIDDLCKLRGSKYVQSEVGEVYCRVKEVLECGRVVLFSGTPCQVAGIKSYLGKDYEKLLTVEVICHGVPSPKLFTELKREMTERHGTLLAISFRDKSEGWSSRAVTGWYASGEKIRERGDLNDYLKAFIAHLTLRHSCEDCQFNDGKSGADVTLGDFWGVESILPELKDDTGVSAVILHTKRGQTEFRRLKCYKKEVQLHDVALCNPSYQAPRVAEKNRNAFMSLSSDQDIHVAARTYIRVSRPSFLTRLVRKLHKISGGGGVNDVRYYHPCADYGLCA